MSTPLKNPYTMQDLELANRILREVNVWQDMIDRHGSMGLDCSQDQDACNAAKHYATQLKAQYFPDMP